MMTLFHIPQVRLSQWITLSLVLLGVPLKSLTYGDESTRIEFSKPIIDIGMVVSDAERSAKFWTEVIGLKEVKGFPVTAELGKKIGLINGHAVQVRVFVEEEVNLATRIKVLSFPEAKSRQADQSTIHATLGIRYLTLYVKDMNQSLERLKKAGVKPIGETPLDLGGGTLITVVKDPDGNFVELIGPARKQ